MKLPFADHGAPSFDDPLGMLSACHGRIHRQLVTLARLQRHVALHGHDDDARAAARAILKYFDTAAPHHHADEERSLLPRLLARDPGTADLADLLLREHGELAARWRKLRPLLSGIVAGCQSTLPPALVHELRRAYDRHIDREETLLIPRARAALAAAELAEIGIEMAVRRGVDLAELA